MHKKVIEELEELIGKRLPFMTFTEFSSGIGVILDRRFAALEKPLEKEPSKREELPELRPGDLIRFPGESRGYMLVRRMGGHSWWGFDAGDILADGCTVLDAGLAVETYRDGKRLWSKEDRE